MSAPELEVTMSTRRSISFVLVSLALVFSGATAAAQGESGNTEDSGEEASESKEKAKSKENAKSKGKAKAQEKASDRAKEKANKKSAVTADGEMKIVDAKAASGVEDREPTGVSDTFSAGDEVTIWMAVRNPKEASEVELVWKRDDAKVSSMNLEVGKSWKWRTWGRIKVQNSGDWSVEIRNPDGETLETVEFSVDGS